MTKIRAPDVKGLVGSEGSELGARNLTFGFLTSRRVQNNLFDVQMILQVTKGLE